MITVTKEEVLGDKSVCGFSLPDLAGSEFEMEALEENIFSPGRVYLAIRQDDSNLLVAFKPLTEIGIMLVIEGMEKP